MKQAIRSTEFWITIYVLVLGVVLFILGHGAEGAVVTSAGSVGYGLSRGIAKNGYGRVTMTRPPRAI